MSPKSLAEAQQEDVDRVVAALEAVAIRDLGPDAGFPMEDYARAAIAALAARPPADTEKLRKDGFRDEWRTVLVDNEDFSLACSLVRNWRRTSDGSDPELIDRIAAVITHTRCAALDAR